MNKAPFHLCVECDEIITNPICTECLAERMRMVIGEYDEQLAVKIIGTRIEGQTQCIFCGQKMALCAHCFSMEVYDFLKESKPEIAAEFASRFDFEIRQNLVEFV